MTVLGSTLARALHWLAGGRISSAASLAIALWLLSLSAAGVAAQEAAAGPSLDERGMALTQVVVGRGETLYRIAKRHNTSVADLQALNNLPDARMLREGQALLIPRLNLGRVQPYHVRPGDTLSDIAQDHGTTVAALRSLNGINGAIRAGQDLLLPRKGGATPFHADFGYGITLFLDQQNLDALISQVAQLGVNWVKLELSWARLEPTRGQPDFAALDAAVAALDALDLRILINIYDAPAWSRISYTAHLHSALRDFGGPPQDPRDFALIMSAIAARYAGLVDAYEIWKAPNLLKYWLTPEYERPPVRNGRGEYGLPERMNIGAEHYMPLLRAARDAIKAVDSEALLLSGGLAPVGFSDHYNAIETGEFLQDLLRLGLADAVDGVGAIFGASAVPPRLLCCQRPPGVETHYESYLQYFRELLYRYHDLLSRQGAAGLPIIVTQAGWGTIDGANLAAPARGLEWLRYTDQQEQAQYTAQAFELAGAADYIKGMFLYNLNGCAVGDGEACFFSLVDAEERARPAFDALRAIAASD